jgi:hypothetical protein
MTMAFFRRKNRRHLISLHRDNARSDPGQSLSGRPLVAETMLDDYDTLLVESPPTQPLLSAPVAEAVNAGTTMERAA